MSGADDSRPTDDQQLAGYLLGLLSDEEAQRLDQASIVDDDVALRLRVVEHDLVDAYVTGTLPGDMLQLFESRYLTSPRRRQNVAFARKLLSAVDRAHAASDDPTGSIHIPSSEQTVPSAPASRPDGGMTPRARVLQVMAAAAVLLVASGALLFQAARLRSGLTVARTEGIALDRRTRALEQQLTEQRAATAAVIRELERVREPAPVVAPSSTQPIALVLRPQTRNIGSVPALAVPTGIDRLALALQLESHEFPRYRIALKDPASDHTLWTSELITATSLGQVPMVVVVIPARLLKSQHYSLVLTGGNTPDSDVISSYTFEVLRR